MASRDKMKPNTTSASRKIADPVPHSGMKTYLFRRLGMQEVSSSPRLNQLPATLKIHLLFPQIPQNSHGNPTLPGPILITNGRAIFQEGESNYGYQENRKRDSRRPRTLISRCD